MAYITRANLEDVFGATTIAQWSNLDRSVNAAVVGPDAARIASAIAYAEDVVESRFRGGRYRVPFVGLAGTIPAEMTDWLARIAGVWLYTSRGVNEEGPDNVTAMREQAMAAMQPYVAGSRRLALTAGDTRMPTAPTVSFGPHSTGGCG